ncbi:MAG: (Na+)-NQR maturation NqrM [Bacteriovoracaceae bacterium]|jgi:hypothetical protein|nr:hypothetical protein [Halobacteriovoraceae bacterium]MDP7319757.1 (Na+)-NQR maturation NqrM [Bacteriovoracaceae bacterium]|tara:strand:+ start:566 stop:793 length:228 start_codon:yes stop_codon:yes gene_type:complete
MDTLLVTISVFLIAFMGMAVGVIISDKVIKGSCGGIGSLMGKSACDICAMKSTCESSGREICEEGTEEDCSKTSC